MVKETAQGIRRVPLKWSCCLLDSEEWKEEEEEVSIASPVDVLTMTFDNVGTR